VVKKDISLKIVSKIKRYPRNDLNPLLILQGFTLSHLNHHLIRVNDLRLAILYQLGLLHLPANLAIQARGMCFVFVVLGGAIHILLVIAKE
jgi:hypothetical protein